MWECLCDCGNIHKVPTDALKNGSIKSCGCSRQSPIPDLVGQKFGRLTVISFSRKDNAGHHHWMCSCECNGNIKEYTGNNLTRGITKSCGCYIRDITSKRRRNDITGKKYGKLTVIQRDETIMDKNNSSFWLCICECGNIKIVRQGDLTRGSVKSCGCLQGEDITGQRFGMLTVLKETIGEDKLNTYWMCKCECGNIKTVKYNNLMSGATNSCGCLKDKNIEEELIGQRFGRLTVLNRDKLDIYGMRYWYCQCDCGNTISVPTHRLKGGVTQSCGCLQRDRTSKAHWKGGITELITFLREQIKEWKQESMKSCDYSCVISGGRFNHIHHLIPFRDLIDEILHAYNLPYKQKIGDYSEYEIAIIKEEIREMHKFFPLGVCLKVEYHREFHSIYGKSNFTVEDFLKYYKMKTGKEFELQYIM